jgi:hypothetical protein
VFAIIGTKETPLAQELDPAGSSPKSGNQNRFFLPISFDNKIDAIKIVFKNNLADDLIFPAIYEEADKEKYYAKKEQERKDGLLKTAQVKSATGSNLVNIYFQPCCEEYKRTEIVLYKDDMMLAKYKINEEIFFHSIGGLAYGKYEFVLKQFDASENILIQTDKLNFTISAPEINPNDFVPYTVI